MLGWLKTVPRPCKIFHFSLYCHLVQNDEHCKLGLLLIYSNQYSQTIISAMLIYQQIPIQVILKDVKKSVVLVGLWLTADKIK